MEPTLASHSTYGAVSGISLPDGVCIGTGSCIYSYCEEKLRQLCAARRTLLKKSSSVVFRSQNGANPGTPNGSDEVSIIASSRLLLNHEHARINEAFARDGGPGCLRALCQFLDAGC